MRKTISMKRLSDAYYKFSEKKGLSVQERITIADFLDFFDAHKND